MYVMDETTKDETQQKQSDLKNESRSRFSVIDRYYTSKYVLDSQANEGEDLCILIHSNRICIITLAPSHPVVKEKKTIKDISFTIGDVNRLSNKVSGKGKRGAQELSAGSPLCHITCSDGEDFTVYAGIRGQLIEVNENLIKQSDLLLKKPKTDGYIAIVFPKLKEFDQVTKKLTPEDEYKRRRPT